MTNSTSSPHPAINELIDLIRKLRGEDGCPWDRKQTPSSMVRYLTEEMYELVDAIESDDIDQIRDELGDVLFHILFIAQLFQEQGLFDTGDVIRRITEKMIRRHPHVFGSTHVESTEEVRKRWHEIKKEEKRGQPDPGILNSVPSSMPALLRAYQLSERAARAGFDWNDLYGVLEKSEEEWTEFKKALSAEDPAGIEIEFGDILFTLVNVARFAHIHPETSLNKALKKFETRFRAMEERIARRGLRFDSLTQAELDRFWSEVKARERRD